MKTSKRAFNKAVRCYYDGKKLTHNQKATIRRHLTRGDKQRAKALRWAQVAMAVAQCAIQIARIASMPMPKFSTGTEVINKAEAIAKVGTDTGRWK